MRINEILTEGYFDRVAHYHKPFDHKEIDKVYNPEAEFYSEINRENSPDSSDGDIKVYIRPEADGNRWTNEPDNKQYSSAGFRGKELIDRITKRS